MEHSEIIGKLLTELESMILDYSGEIDHIVLNNMEFNLANEIIETLRNSPVDFAITYYNASDEMKERISNLIRKACQFETDADEIINETLNLYFLNSHNLLEEEDIAPQRITAIEKLEQLQRLISSYIEDKDYISEDEIENRRMKAEKIYAIGTIFGNGEQSDVIEDIETLEKILNTINLTEEEKMYLVTSILEKNVEFYEERVAEHNRRIQEEVEKNKQEVEEEIASAKEQLPELTPEQAEEIENLLSKPSVIEKIVRIVNDDINNTIRVENPNAEDDEIIKESISLAREAIVEIILNENLTPKEALEKFFKETDQTKETKNKMLHEILDGTEDLDLSYENQVKIINNGIDFYRKNKKTIQNLSKQEREIISKYMFTIYKSKDQRRLLYQSKSFNDSSKIIAESAYEIQVLINLIDSLDQETDEYKQMLKNASKRILDILECVKEIEFTAVKPPKSEENTEGSLYYLMRNDNKSIIENDIRPDEVNKGISLEYYEDILSALNEIRNRSDNDFHISIAPGDNYRYMRKNGVQITYTGSRVQILYIPINKRDAIIVGAIFSDGKRGTYREQDDRIRRYQGRIDDLRMEIDEGNEFVKESSRIIDKRLRDALSQENKKSEIKQMLETNDKANPGKKKKK